MQHYRYLVLLALLFTRFSAAEAKENKDLMRAKYYYAHYDYYEAIPYFEKVAGEVNTALVYSQLADCYSITNNLGKASEAYEKAVNAKDCSHVIVLRYAQLLMQMGRYDEAEKWLEKYRGTNSKDKRVANLIAGCVSAKAMAAALPQGTATLLALNTDGSDVAPTMWKGKLVFASDTAIGLKKKTDNSTGKSYYNIYSVPCDNKGHCGSEFTKVTETKELNNKYHNGPCTFSADGKQMYFTRSRYDNKFFSKKSVSNEDSVVVLEIMIATDYDTANKKFKTIKPFQYNSEAYAVAHPSVSPNGKTLVFSSNMPKGSGGSDLYLCRKTNSGWSKPQNVGSMINTEGEELFPYWADDNTLFFSSDGHEGLGGLDIYRATWNEKINAFSTPENVGMPLNSSYDDISLALKADGGSCYFSSNRPADKGGDNIYFYKKEKVWLQLNIIDSVSRQPLPGVNISMHAVKYKKDTAADNNGQLLMQLYPELQYSTGIYKDGYERKQLMVNATSNKEVDTIFKTIQLAKPPTTARDSMNKLSPELVVIKNKNVMDSPGIRNFNLGEIYEVGHFYYEYDKYELTEAHQKFLDTLLTQLHRHTSMRIEIRAHTDCRGGDAYNQVLSNKRALTVVNYLANHGISRKRLEYIGLGYSMPTVKCPVCEQCTEQEHSLNRLLEFKVLRL
jgi:peptidoglycan-associated lipoprotein